MPGRKPSLLILGGTGDAVQLSHAAESRFGERLGVIYSLAGRTRAAAEAGGELCVGGFGGVDGLARYIRDNNIDFLIDASHPFAAQISQHACLAAAATATPRCVLTRPPWQARHGDNWHEAADMAAAEPTSAWHPASAPEMEALNFTSPPMAAAVTWPPMEWPVTIALSQPR